MRPSAQRILVALQIALLVAMTLTPAMALAADPSPDPSPSAEASPDPTPEPTEPSPPEDPSPTEAASAEEPTQAPDPTPTDEPTPAETPAATDAPAPDPTTAPAAAPSITSDKADYAPGELVTLTGAGWQPGETVHIFVNDDWGSSWTRSVDVTADASGGLADQFNLPSWFVAVYTVVATGDANGHLPLHRCPAAERYCHGDSHQPSHRVGTATYGNVVVKFNGNAQQCTVDLAVDGPLPAGATATFGSTVLTSTGADASTPFSIVTTAATPAGTTIFKIEATPRSNCQNGAQVQETSDLSLVVAKRVGTVTVGTQSGSVTFGTPGSVTYSVTVTKLGNGSGTFNLTAPLVPGGVTASFSPSTLTYAAGDTSKSATLTLTTSAATQAATGAAFSVVATNAGQSADSSLGAGSLAVNKASSTTTVTCTAGPFVYTGSAFTPCSVTVTGAGGLSLTPAPSYDDNTDAGTATASYTYAGDANHTGSSDSKTFTIDKASSTTSMTCPANVTYTGSAHTPCTAKVTGAGGLDQSLTVGYTNNTDAGRRLLPRPSRAMPTTTAAATRRPSRSTRPSSTTAVTCPASVTYTGTPQTPCTANVTGAGGLNQTLTVNYANNTNAGTATACASFAGDANHTGSTDTEDLHDRQGVVHDDVTCPVR